MTAPRRMGSENSETRRLLIDVTEQLMLKEGYAAVGVRRVAREAGVTPALVLYYFRTLDDLFLAVLQRGLEQELARQTDIRESDRPMRALWALSSHPGTTLITEFMALANHRTAIRAEILDNAERLRKAQLESLVEAVEQGRLDLRGTSPMAVLVLTTAVSRVLVMEDAMGLSYGHEETLALVEQLLGRIDNPPPDAAEPDSSD